MVYRRASRRHGGRGTGRCGWRRRQISTEAERAGGSGERLLLVLLVLLLVKFLMLLLARRRQLVRVREVWRRVRVRVLLYGIRMTVLLKSRVN
jgi:hypothetical protein